MQKHLKKFRVVISLIFLSVTGYLFIDFSNSVPTAWYSSILYLQFVPSLVKFIHLMSWTALGFLVVLILTLLFGRVYCSTICPLGILQDVITFISKRFKKKRKRRFKYAKPHNILRYSILIITIGLWLSGFIIAVNFLDPYSNFGRITSNLFRPVYIGLNNIGANILELFDVYYLYPVSLKGFSWLHLIFPVVIFGLVLWLAITKGRLYCNTVCPVGTFLGFLSKYSLFRIKINHATCTLCGHCAVVCKASCINLKKQEVDFSRCVGCFNCLQTCPEFGIKYSFAWKIPKKQPSIATNQQQFTDVDKRRFFKQALLYTLGFLGMHKVLKAQDVVKNKIPTKVAVKKEHPVAPPGAGRIELFNDVCTGCHLCVTACVTNVLQPSLLEYGLVGMLQPHMDYSTSFCNYECTICGEVCPTGAIQPLTVESKKVAQIGIVHFIKENCIVHTENTACGACAEHCPTQAVHMVPYKNGITQPEIDTSICIGCGACEYICPVTPHKAIYVDGNPLHQIAEKPKIEELDKQVDDEEAFPF